MNRSSLVLSATVLAVSLFCALPAGAQLVVLQRCNESMADAEKMAATVPECFALLEAARKKMYEDSQKPRDGAAVFAPPEPPKHLDFKGFVCKEPPFVLENRRAMTAVLNAAHICLVDVEAALARPDRAVLDALDEREEKIARMSLKLNKYFESGKNPIAGAPKAAAPVPKKEGPNLKSVAPLPGKKK